MVSGYSRLARRFSRLQALTRHWQRVCLLLLLALPAAAEKTSSTTGELRLPELADSGAGLMTPAREAALGQAWLRAFRASVPLYEDPLLFEYLEDLMFKLASFSELETREFDLVVVDNPTINAFAVPGRIIGVHTGLLLQAETEAQLASVLTHELAHLSRRHFARSVEAARRGNFVNLAGLLAGVVLAASGSGGDAATAAIVSSQAAALENQLRYSRIHEKEADRAGMQTLVKAGYPATAAAEMFQQMLDIKRLNSSQIPEFLLTHPVTESRVADASNRARNLSDIPAGISVDYQLMRTRLLVRSARSKNIIAEYKKRLADRPDAPESAIDRYGLALAYAGFDELDAARRTLAPLIGSIPGRIPYTLLDIEIDIKSDKLQRAEIRLRDLFTLMPENYAVGMQLAEVLAEQTRHAAAARVLEKLADDRPAQQDIWYHLAETYGRAGEIANLHIARAEFFILRAAFAQAREQLNYALRISADNYVQSSRIKQRLREVNTLASRQKAL